LGRKSRFGNHALKFNRNFGLEGDIVGARIARPALSDIEEIVKHAIENVGHQSIKRLRFQTNSGLIVVNGYQKDDGTGIILPHALIII
jgi:hypothetical protein